MRKNQKTDQNQKADHNRKREIRQRILAERRMLKETWIREQSERICTRLINSYDFQESSCIFTYFGCRGEVLTEKIIEQALLQGKKVAVPKVIRDEMEFYYIHSLADLEPGYYDIPEPKSGEKALESDHSSILMVMPGVAFDEERNRVGYGGGFYDRYLIHHDRSKKIALAFEIQIVDRVPATRFDICPDLILTETREI